MTDPWYLVSAVAISAAITWTLRAAPFLVVGQLRRAALVRELSEQLPLGIMIILVMYSVGGLGISSLSEGAVTAASLCVTVALQLWRRNAALSILAGTAVQVTLLSSLG
ncbi:branched-chain amino acid transporter permease [Mycetocola reblochoni]|uniref:Branched-chain amino acid transport n=2 Tax=Mycetocola reblochoni TaxID=331618 RepID=A0A1R4JMI8_9MICO|nr:AzlD domain-containing protein [Mycetocola reblochoni]RLP68606.1 branched-chain amino acid ABC transporter [Mycetocola reblochoni]SJN33491.1 branched-chain amino acid transport [Mycetocola reblochoni REB411]